MSSQLEIYQCWSWRRRLQRVPHANFGNVVVSWRTVMSFEAVLGQHRAEYTVRTLNRRKKRGDNGGSAPSAFSVVVCVFTTKCACRCTPDAPNFEPNAGETLATRIAVSKQEQHGTTAAAARLTTGQRVNRMPFLPPPLWRPDSRLWLSAPRVRVADGISRFPFAELYNCGHKP